MWQLIFICIHRISLSPISVLRLQLYPLAWNLGYWFRIPLDTWMLMCFYSVFCVRNVLARAHPPSKDSYRRSTELRRWKSGQVPTKNLQNCWGFWFLYRFCSCKLRSLKLTSFVERDSSSRNWFNKRVKKLIILDLEAPRSSTNEYSLYTLNWLVLKLSIFYAWSLLLRLCKLLN